ncbi:MAG TPA: hypothetical protein VGD65_04790 [Chryseosolibacter sp.]
MKKIFLLLTLITCIVACQDSKDAAQNLPRRYDPSVGSQIPLNVAYAWVANFGGSVAAGREQSSYSFSAATLGQLLSATEGPGVVFHHATDGNGAPRMMMFTLGAEGELFQSDILDLSTGAILNAETAQQWAAAYAAAHPATPWYHFFGNDIFTEIQSNEAFEYVNVVRALNNEGEEQVLLFVYNTKNIQGGRIEGEEVTVYDVSSPCPPCEI